MAFLNLKCIPTYFESKNNIACKPFRTSKMNSPEHIVTTHLLFYSQSYPSARPNLCFSHTHKLQTPIPSTSCPPR